MGGGLAGGHFFVYGLAVYILHVKVLPDTPQREVVYSGATKLSDEAQMLADDMLAAYIFNHYNWKYDFLRPTIEQIVQEYLKLHGDEAPEEEEEEVEEETEEAKDGAADGDGGEGGRGSRVSTADGMEEGGGGSSLKPGMEEGGGRK